MNPLNLITAIVRTARRFIVAGMALADDYHLADAHMELAALADACEDVCDKLEQLEHKGAVH